MFLYGLYQSEKYRQSHQIIHSKYSFKILVFIFYVFCNKPNDFLQEWINESHTKLNRFFQKCLFTQEFNTAVVGLMVYSVLTLTGNMESQM